MKNRLSLRCPKKLKFKTTNMGRKRLEKPGVEALFPLLSSMLVPSDILSHFDIWDVQENKDRWVIEMREKEGLIPSTLSDFEDVVLDGFCNSSEVLSHGFSLKPIYLRLYRRRYKRSNSDDHFSNQYDVTQEGVKIVPTMGTFLKEPH